MESMKGQGGIQKLLNAEQEAKSIVSYIKNMKMATLKQAKEEVEREVASYRSQLEADYQRNIFAEHRLEREEATEEKIKNSKKLSSTVSKDIMDMQIKYVAAVKV